jgi:hypothetical protein
MHKDPLPGPRHRGNLAWPALLLGAAALVGCAGQHVRVDGTWESESRQQTFTRVLVVGVTPSVNQRCLFERFMASKISNEATTTVAIASCSVVASKNPLTRESIEQAVAAQGADAVLATRLVSKQWEEEKRGSRDTRGSASYKATDAGYATGYYGVYGVPVIYGDFETAPAASFIEGEVQVSSQLYAIQGPTLVYTLETTAGGFESTDAGTSAITAAIAGRLHRDGLIR